MTLTRIKRRKRMKRMKMRMNISMSMRGRGRRRTKSFSETEQATAASANLFRTGAKKRSGGKDGRRREKEFGLRRMPKAPLSWRKEAISWNWLATVTAAELWAGRASDEDEGREGVRKKRGKRREEADRQWI